MARFVIGNKVKVCQPSSPYRGRKGTVVKSIDHGFIVFYDVKMDSCPAHLNPSNRFSEADIEPA